MTRLRQRMLEDLQRAAEALGKPRTSGRRRAATLSTLPAAREEARPGNSD